LGVAHLQTNEGTEYKAELLHWIALDLCKCKTNFVPNWFTSVKNYSFYEQVFDIVRAVPYGRVTTYGAIATYLGAKRSSRLVGWAMNISHGTLPPVPAHRVVNRQGLLTGKAHFAHPNRMQELLESEGVAVAGNQVVRFNDIFWDPSSLDRP
jgi:methylated-DNA-protein-cysteine methyltransferase-like protein